MGATETFHQLAMTKPKQSCQHLGSRKKRALLFLRAPQFTCEGQGKEESLLDKYLPESCSLNLGLLTNHCTCEPTKYVVSEFLQLYLLCTKSTEWSFPQPSSCIPLAMLMPLPCVSVNEPDAASMDLKQNRDQFALEKHM